MFSERFVCLPDDPHLVFSSSSGGFCPGSEDQLGSAFNPRITSGIPVSSCHRIQDRILHRGWLLAEMVLTARNPMSSGRGPGGFESSKDMSLSIT